MNDTTKTLIVIEGPTASGKTGVSVELAKLLKTCIISADSRQFYKEMAIGTAKPDAVEQEGILHYFIDSHSLENEVTAAIYEQEALKTLENEFNNHQHILLVGGSGMFIDALCLGLDDIPTSKELKQQIQEEYENFGLAPLLEELKSKDPEYYSTVDQKNPMRIQRAIEVIRLTKKTYTEQRVRRPKKRNFTVKRFVLNHERSVLYERINSRVDLMMENGLLNEVKALLPYRKNKAMNTVGYKELFEFIDGKTSLEQAVENIKQNTRRYAKRQLTWFRKHQDATWIDYQSKQQVVQEIEDLL